MAGKARAVWCGRNLQMCGIYYGLCLTEEQFRGALKHLRVPAAEAANVPFLGAGANATTHVMDTKRGRTAALVCMHPHEEHFEEAHVGLIVHEAVHIWQFHCRAIGDDKPSDEAEAYAIQSITQELLGAYQTQYDRLHPKKEPT